MAAGKDKDSRKGSGRATNKGPTKHLRKQVGSIVRRQDMTPRNVTGRGILASARKRAADKRQPQGQSTFQYNAADCGPGYYPHVEEDQRESSDDIDPNRFNQSADDFFGVNSAYQHSAQSVETSQPQQNIFTTSAQCGFQQSQGPQSIGQLGSAIPTQGSFMHGVSEPLYRDLPPTHESQGHSPSLGYERYDEFPSQEHSPSGGDEDAQIFDPVTGAPMINEILTNYSTHKACRIWMEDEAHKEKILTVYRRDKWVKNMLKDYKEGLNSREQWADIVQQSRLMSIAGMPLTSVDHVLISAFVERWQPNTNTFNFPWGELTVTLHDVKLISGLPIDGDAVTAGMSNEECKLAMHNAFGFEMNVMDTYYSHGGVVSKDLRAAKASLAANGDRASDLASAFLFELIGSTLFLDKSTNKVHTRLATMVFDHDRTRRLAWGTGTLAYLYRALGEASRAGVTTMCGFSALLERWIWLYFPSFHGHSAASGTNMNLPIGSHHAQADRTRFKNSTSLMEYRTMLDNLPAEDVIWFPYRHWNIDWTSELRLSAYRGTIQFMSIHEAYHPDRVLRQFGRVQCVPLPHIKPLIEDRPLTGSGYVVQYKDEDDHWSTRYDNTCLMISQARLSISPWEMEKDYLEWYLPRCHPYLLKESFASAAPRVGGPTLPVDITRRFQMMMSIVDLICTEGRGASIDEMLRLRTIGYGLDPPLMSQTLSQSSLRQSRKDGAGSSNVGR